MSSLLEATPTPRDFVSLTHDPIIVDPIVEKVKDPGCGAIATFYGTTRDNFENKAVTGLSYEAYEDMAISEMQGICNKVGKTVINWV
jgi:molybdopterin synthase catalytic subunit